MPRKPILLLFGLIASVWFWGCASYTYGDKFIPSGEPAKKPDPEYKLELSENSDTVSVTSATFSPDGKQVISGFEDSTLSLWDLTTGRMLRTFQKRHTDAVTSVVFHPDGKQVLSGSKDKTVRLWNIEDGRELRVFEHEKEVNSVVFHPDGKQALSCSDDKTVRLWNIEDGRELRVFKHEKEVTAISFNSDGTQILSGSKDFIIRLWDTETGREIRPFPGHLNTITSVSFSPNGQQILSDSSDGTARLWNVSNGSVINIIPGLSNSFSSFMPNGLQILSFPSSSHFSGDQEAYFWDAASDKPTKAFSVISYEFRRPLSFSADKKLVLYSMEIYKSKINKFKQYFALFHIPTGGKIAQFARFENDEWVIITPDNFYNTSPNGEWNISAYSRVYNYNEITNHWYYWGWEPSYINTRNTFYNPLIVANRLQGRSDDTIQPGEAIPNNTSVEPPVVVIRSPENRAELSSAQVVLSVSVVDPKNPVKAVKILINGEPVGSDDMKGISGIKGLSVTAAGLNITGDENRVDFRLPITLNAGRNRIEVLASNAYSESREAVEVSFTPSGPYILPNLWILSIGVNSYAAKDQLKPLKYAVDDAKAIIDIFKTQEGEGKLYHKVNSRLIADDADIKPSRDEIIDNFAWLKQASPRDTVILFIAGHGVNDEGGNFWFMPSDAAFNPDGSIRLSRAIPYRDIHMMFNMPGQNKLLFIDACHSEGTSGKKARSVDNNQLINSLKNDTNDTTIILASSQGSELSLESDYHKHGLFTYAIIEGLKGEADLIKDGSITINELNAYVSGTVPRLSNGHQHPTIYIPSSYTDFKVADLK